MNERSEHDEQNLLERATDALLDELVAPPSGDLIAKTQAAVQHELAVGRLEQNPFLHPVLRIAAMVVLAIGGLAIYTAISRSFVPPVVSQRLEDRTAPAPAPIDVAGVVRFAGVAPRPQPISMAANAACAAHHRGPVVDESIVVNSDGTLRNVVVWVSGGLEGKQFAPPSQPAVLDQQGCVYTPHVVAVMTGQQLLVKNSDPFSHNVRAAAANNPSFNIGQPTVDHGKPFRFFLPERMYVKCDMHPWMNAYIHIIDNPFFAVSDEHGNFKLPPTLPPGEYTVSAWHEVYGEQRTRVKVEAGKSLNLQFTFNPDQHADASDVMRVPGM